MTYEEQKEEAWGLCGKLAIAAEFLCFASALELGERMVDLYHAMNEYNAAIFALADRKRKEEEQ